MLRTSLIEARRTSKLITQGNANETIKNKIKKLSSLHSSFAFMLLHNRTLLILSALSSLFFALARRAF
jgi:chaperone required for assembly of F1-ATPase